MRILLVLVVLVLGVATRTQAQAQGDAAAFVGACSRLCGAFETCFVYEGAEYCTPFCAPGRCNDTSEVCIVEGRACNQAPCLPVAVCEAKVLQPLMPQTAINSTGEDSAVVNCTRECPLVDVPVCGSDNISYANQCFFEQAQCVTPSLTLAHSQLCDADIAFNIQYNNDTAVTTPVDIVTPPECDAMVCAQVDDPVCTTNGTMMNLCFFKKAQCKYPQITLLRRIACEDPSGLIATCPANCTQAFVPVCASNGVVYGNECLFRQAKCERREFGELRARDLSDCYLQVGDSQGAAIDVASWLASSG